MKILKRLFKKRQVEPEPFPDYATYVIGPDNPLFAVLDRAMNQDSDKPVIATQYGDAIVIKEDE